MFVLNYQKSVVVYHTNSDQKAPGQSPLTQRHRNYSQRKYSAHSKMSRNVFSYIFVLSNLMDRIDLVETFCPDFSKNRYYSTGDLIFYLLYDTIEWHYVRGRFCSSDLLVGYNITVELRYIEYFGTGESGSV